MEEKELVTLTVSAWFLAVTTIILIFLTVSGTIEPLFNWVVHILINVTVWLINRYRKPWMKSIPKNLIYCFLGLWILIFSVDLASDIVADKINNS